MDHHHDINPTLNEVRGRPPMFVFPSKTGENAALVRWCSLVFTPTVAKTVAILPTFLGGQFAPRPIVIAPQYVLVPLYEDAVYESAGWTRYAHRIPMRVKHLAVEAGKDVAEALRDILVMVAGEAAKRAIWG